MGPTGMKVYAGHQGKPLREWIAQREAHIHGRLRYEQNEASIRQMQGALQELERLEQASLGEDPDALPPQPGG